MCLIWTQTFPPLPVSRWSAPPARGQAGGFLPLGVGVLIYDKTHQAGKSRDHTAIFTAQYHCDAGSGWRSE